MTRSAKLMKRWAVGRLTPLSITAVAQQSSRRWVKLRCSTDAVKLLAPTMRSSIIHTVEFARRLLELVSTDGGEGRGFKLEHKRAWWCSKIWRNGVLKFPRHFKYHSIIWSVRPITRTRSGTASMRSVEVLVAPLLGTKPFPALITKNGSGWSCFSNR